MTGANGQELNDAGRDWRRSALRGVITPLVAGLVLAVLAPFGTAYYGVPVRVLYWVSLTLAGGLGAMSAQWGLARLQPDAPTWLRIVVQTLGATAFVAPFVFFVFGDAWQAVGLTLFYIAVISAVISTVGELSARRTEDTAPLQMPSRSLGRPPLMERLPPRFRDAALHALSSEDHYVRVHTSAGEHMLLMRLSDAQDLAAPTPGVKPHRSWWVAEAGAARISRSDGKLVIALPDDTRVPVSRSGAKALREAGWV